MAHTVGVPKRDPCGKCQMPVFLMERMVVSGRVYHRTCLKCARCKSQLTLGNFYETEVDEQYCCETCPDEDIIDDNLPTIFREEEKIASRSTTPPEIETESKEVFDTFTKITRHSIRERLAFFEKHFESVEDNNNKIESKTTVSSPTSSSNNTDINNRLLQNNNDCSSDQSIVVHAGLTQFVEQLPLSKPSTSDQFDLKSASSDLFDKSITPASVKNDLDTFNSDIQSNIIDLKDNIQEEHLVTKESLKEYEDLEQKSKLEIGNKNSSAVLEDLETTERLNIVRSRLELFDNIIEKTNDYIPKDVELEPNENCDHQIEEKDSETENEVLNEDLSNHKDDINMANNSEKDCFETTPNENVVQSVDEEVDKEIGFESDITLEDIKITSESIKDTPTSTITLVSSKFEETFDKTGTSEVIETTNNFSLPSINNNNSNTTTTKQKELEEEKTTEKETFLAECRTGADNTAEEAQQPFSEHFKVERSTIEDYPKDLDPFMSSDENEAEESKEMKSNNPFDSSDDEIELEKTMVTRKSPKIAPPRPPPPRCISKNPFDDDSDKEAEDTMENLSKITTPVSMRKAPVPTPRTLKAQPKIVSPKPTPRASTQNSTRNSSDLTANVHIRRASDAQLLINSPSSLEPSFMSRNCDVRASNNSINSINESALRSRKTRRAPVPPAMQSPLSSVTSTPVLLITSLPKTPEFTKLPSSSPVYGKELFPSTETISSCSITSTPSSSTMGTPKSGRKKRLAPAPPKPPRIEMTGDEYIEKPSVVIRSKNLLKDHSEQHIYEAERKRDSKLSDEEKALLDGKRNNIKPTTADDKTNDNLSFNISIGRSTKRLIPLDEELLEEHGQSDDLKEQNQRLSNNAEKNDELNIVYRRCVMLPDVLEPNYSGLQENIDEIRQEQHYSYSLSNGERQLEKLKDNKEAKNRNRQSQISAISSGTDEFDNSIPLYNKSIQGKWKRRKGPAPSLPVPPRRILQMLPLQEIKHELEIIEVQQQGLEKQGVILEKMIRDRCEGQKSIEQNVGEEESVTCTDSIKSSISSVTVPTSVNSAVGNTKEVEYLILQLFELVNEKNELFRRQAELMYLRRQHRLEQEQADLEYEIRVLMAQPERNKTDTDKAREEILIERLIEVVSLRNQVIDCLEMDRLREAEEDQSIKQRLELHLAQRDKDQNLEMAARKLSQTKLSKKEKLKQKEAKKLSKTQKIDADKDADESQMPLSAASVTTGDKNKTKKKRRLFPF